MVRERLGHMHYYRGPAVADVPDVEPMREQETPPPSPPHPRPPPVHVPVANEDAGWSPLVYGGLACLLLSAVLFLYFVRS